MWGNPLVWVVVSAFLPYLIQGVGLRFEHLVIYAFGAWGMAAILRAPISVKPPGLGIAAVFLACAALAVLVTVLVPASPPDPLDVVSELDHYFRPIALALGVGGWAMKRSPASIRYGMRQVCLVALVLLGVNTVLSLAGTAFDIRTIVEPFRSAREVDLSQASAVDLFLDYESLGRVTGIFGLPFDAGVAYSVGLFAWAYLVKMSRRPISAGMYLALLTTVIGGLLPVSKAFILGGIPLFCVYWLWGSRHSRLLTGRLVIGLSAAVLAINILLVDWAGIPAMETLIAQIVDGDSPLLNTATAGRFGASDSVVIDQLAVLSETGRMVFGMGLGTGGPFDNSYVAFLVQGGILALASYVILLVVLMAMGWKWRQLSEEARFLFILVVYVAGAGMGAPVASVVRASTLLWLVLLLSLATVSRVDLQRSFASRGTRYAPSYRFFSDRNRPTSVDGSGM